MSTTDPMPTPPIATSGGPGGRLLPLAMAAGLLAGLASWAAGEATLNAFRPPTTTSFVYGREVVKATFADQAAADKKNAALAYAELGAALGLALGLAGGLARRAAYAGASAAALGLVLGAALGAGGAFATLPFYFHAKDVSPEELSRDMVLPLMVHAGAWSAVGLAGGLALAVGVGVGSKKEWARASRAAVGGLVGAAVAAVVFEVIGGLAFSEAKTDEPLSRTWATRLLARLAVALFVAAAAALAAQEKPARAPKRGPADRASGAALP